MARATEYTGAMEEVVEICGRAVADELVEVLGGLNLYIPKVVNDGSPLEKLGEASAACLVAAFGGSTIYVSHPRPAPIDPAEIEAMIAKGHTIQQIALRLETTERQILRIRAAGGQPKIGSRPDPRQLRLFAD